MPPEIKIVFIGTGATAPFNLKRLPCVALKFGNHLALFDAGEGCQYGIIKNKLHPVKSALWIFLSHLHADHISGLPGLLHTLNLSKKRGIVRVFGPVGTKDFLSKVIDTFLIHPLSYVIDVNEIRFEDKPYVLVTETNDFIVIAFKTEHDIDSTGYIFQEKRSPIFDAKKADELGIPPILRKKLVEGKSITLPDGKIIKPSDILKPPPPGRKIVYTGDTRPINNPKILELFANADLLIHEATFIKQFHMELSLERYHSTIEDAIETAFNVNAKTLALVHISSRYNDRSSLLKMINEYSARVEARSKKHVNIIVPDDDYVLTL